MILTYRMTMFYYPLRKGSTNKSIAEDILKTELEQNWGRAMGSS